jgi:glycosyltransferase involved in cell wall biosynthesis
MTVAEGTPGARGRGDPDVTFFLPNLHGGGAQQVFCNLSRAFARRGYAVDLLVTWDQGQLSGAVPDGVRTISLSPPSVPVVGSAAGIPRMVTYLSEAQPSVLYSAMTYANISAVVAARLADSETSTVLTEHTMPEQNEASLKGRAVNRLAGALYPSADAVVAVSESVARGVSARFGLDAEDVSVVHNPILTANLDDKAAASLERDWVPADATDVLVSVGRLAEVKDFPTLLRSLALLVDEYDRDAALVLFGKGPQRERLAQSAAELGVDERVSMPGYVDNPFKYLRRASVFVSSSRFEGLPTAIVEALACGCPVVATDCPGGSREVLADGRYGSLVPVGDHGALARAVDETLSSPPPTETLRGRAEDFETETVVDDHLRLLRSVSPGLEIRSG